MLVEDITYTTILYDYSETTNKYSVLVVPKLVLYYTIYAVH